MTGSVVWESNVRNIGTDSHFAKRFGVDANKAPYTCPFLVAAISYWR